jgi:CRP-like cAMP-binding protein
VRPEIGPRGDRRNRLLASLSQDEQERLAPFLDLVPLPRNTRVAERGERIEHVYFPIDAVTSTLMELSEGDSVEVGLMGAEGVTGLSLLYTEDASNSTIIVQIAGSGMRMRADDFRHQIVERGGPTYQLLLRYANAFMEMVAQVAACNASHDIQQRFARWLLMAHDRVARDTFPLTHEYAALMLGVRRASVTQAANGLRVMGAIGYESGVVRIVDREVLQKASCGCYPVIERAIETIFAQRVRA